MAALDGKITIEHVLRPCIVRIPANTTTKRVKTEKPGVYKHEVVEIEPERAVKALFHCWDYRSEFYDASPMIGGHPGGQVSGTFAIIEYEDGTVHEVEPNILRFVDNTFCEYVFPETEGFSKGDN